ERSQIDPAEAVLKTVELHFTVDRDGRVDNVTSPTTDVPDAVVKSSIASMKRSRYAPRIDNGAAVSTDDVVFVERVLVKATSVDTPPASGAAGAPAPAEQVPETPPAAEPKEPEKQPGT